MKQKTTFSMKKTITRILVITLSILFLAACGGRKEVLPDTAYMEYVTAFTGGTLPEGSTIRVQLTRPAEARPQEGLFTFSPSLAGSIRWVSDDLVEFIPDQNALVPGQRYKATFALGATLPVRDRKYSQFPFRFAVASRKASLTADRTLLEADSAAVEGTIRLSAPLEPDQVRGMIRITGADGTPRIRIGNGTGKTDYPFSISGIARNGKDKTLKISLQEAGTGFKVPEPLSVDIPAKGGFRVLQTRHITGKDPYIEIQFSEPVAAVPQGIIQLDGAARTYFQTDRNLVKVFYAEASRKDLRLTVDTGMRSADGQPLDAPFEQTIRDEAEKPAVTIPLQGNILPDDKNLILPFRTIGLRGVDLRVIRIYQDNILTFLQDNELGGEEQLRRSGRLVHSQHIRLDEDPDRDLTVWQDWSADLGGLFRREPGAIYRIRLTFRMDDALCNVPAAGNMLRLDEGQPTEEETAVWDMPNTYYWDNDFVDWDLYDWRERDNPAHPSYYMLGERFPSVNLMTSDIGLLAKYAGGDKLWVTATDLNTAKPLSGADIEAYNFQLRPVGSGKTGSDGNVTLSLQGKPFAVVARRGKTASWLKVTDGNEKSLSRFDVGGRKIEKGLKSFIYGERGVWRPGDTLHLTMILQDKGASLPENHPATLELYTPQGQFHSRQGRTATDGFYAFALPTLPEDPTGFWNAYIKVGGSTFHKSVRIESVKPNRLKINLDMGSKVLQGGTRTQASVDATWLTGPAAAGLPVKAEMTLTTAGTRFKGFEGYSFLDPTKAFRSGSTRLIDTRLDGKGSARLGIDLPEASDAPGMLTATIVCSVEEPGGDASFIPVTLPYSPYSAYVGLKMPEGTLETDKDHVFQVAVVDRDGRRVAGHNLEYRIFRMDWSWWWESRAEELDSYVNGTAANVFSSGRLVSDGAGDVRIPFRLDYPQWGRFLLYVKDLDSGHAAGSVFMADWPAYRGRSDKKDPTALTMLSFSLDKTAYEAGETATLYVPAAKNGRALVSIENGSGVLRQDWVPTDAERETPFTFKIDPGMAPNFYVHLTLLQPHSQTANDLPIRMYGVQPVLVNAPESHLEPVISMPDAVHPEEPFTVRVSEKSGRPMTYTLALVDEGLLEITAFKTPDPWTGMYAREALGVKTWDLYDEVIGAYSGRFSPMFSVGGDQDILLQAKKDNRFNPVVRFLGPFTLQKGTGSHQIRLPMYVGSLRVMVVAGHDGAFGHADKTVAVRSPLMVLPTLPRTLAPGEQVTLPVNVFAMENDVRQASVSVKAEGPVRIAGAASQEITFAQAGDQLVRFALETTGEGPATITVRAAGGSHQATETLHIQVRNNQPAVTRVRQQSLAAGETATLTWEPAVKATLSLAQFPAFDAAGAWSFVRDYRYSCSEQLAARGLTVLHTLDMVPEKLAEEAPDMLAAITRELYGRQLPDGGFAYWPGDSHADAWVTSMAGQFLTEASAKGYRIEPDVLASWKNFQKKAVQNWRASDKVLRDLDQAYRLHTLALAGDPDAGAMNRLKEQANLSPQSRWMLAAAYAACGKKPVAVQLIDGIPESLAAYSGDALTFGSLLRDKAVAVMAQALCDRGGQALALAGDVAEAFSAGASSTQETAFAAMAMDLLSGQVADGTLSAEVDGKAVNTPKSIWTAEADPASGKLTLKNLSQGPVHATLTTLLQPAADTPVAARHAGLRLTVAYTDLQGKAVNPATLRQGDEFTAEIRVISENSLQDYTRLALDFPLPSGWEIYNERLTGTLVAAQNAYDYQDIRDDRSVWYFDLPRGTSKTFKLRLRAAYEGRFLQPPVTCKAMYDSQVAGNTASGTATVTR